MAMKLYIITRSILDKTLMLVIGYRMSADGNIGNTIVVEVVDYAESVAIQLG